MSTYTQFYDKKFQKLHGYPADVKPFDFHYEKLYYGKVDENQNAVILTDPQYLIQLSPKDPYVALDFVAKAYEGFERHITKAVAMDKIPRSPFVSSLRLKRAHRDPRAMYDQHINNSLYSLVSDYLLNSRKNQKIRNYSDFVLFFEEYMKDFAHLLPTTITGFIKSKFCPRNISGLVIELKSKAGSYKYGKTEDVQKIINDPNFAFYRNAAAKFGFYIDESAPWCLIANISSIEMQNNWVITQRPTPGQIQAGKADGLSDSEIIKKYTTVVSDKGLIWKPGNASNLFDLYYQRTENIDAIDFIKIMPSFYISFVETYPNVRVESPYRSAKLTKCGSKKMVEFTREPIDISAMSIRNSRVLSTYLICRMGEESLEIPKQNQKGILKKARHVQKKFDFLKALMYINKRIQDYKSLESQNAVFTPKDKKMTLDCQNFETCGIKKVDQKKYNKYVQKPFA